MSFPHSSVAEESACNAGDPSSIPGLGRSAGEEIHRPLQYSWASLVAQLVKNPSAMQRTHGSNPGLGRSPGEGKGYPLQYSGLENSMNFVVHGVTMSRTWLTNFHFHSVLLSYNMRILSLLLLHFLSFPSILPLYSSQNHIQCYHFVCVRACSVMSIIFIIIMTMYIVSTNDPSDGFQ